MKPGQCRLQYLSEFLYNTVFRVECNRLDYLYLPTKNNPSFPNTFPHLPDYSIGFWNRECKCRLPNVDGEESDNVCILESYFVFGLLYCFVLLIVGGTPDSY